MHSLPDQVLQDFAKNHHIEKLTTPSLTALKQNKQGYSLTKAKKFLQFQKRIDKQLLQHPVIVKNNYTHWFEKGSQNLDQVRAFTIQFSVFSNQFLIAQLKKMINADTLENMRASKEILANELGVRFQSDNNKQVEGIWGSTEGSIERSTFRFAAAHFEWLYNHAKKLGLEFHQIGKPVHGTKSTLFFCDELLRLYGGADYEISQSVSYAVENWAAAGFWGQLIRGYELFNAQNKVELPLGFFIWHDRIESQHAEHTQQELEEIYFLQGIDEDAFIRYGNEMLDGVAVFWDGLNEQRLLLATKH